MERGHLWPLAFLAVFIVVVSWIPLSAKALPPTVTEILHVPKYPHVGDPVNVTARVESAAAIDFVQLFYCALGGGVCQHWTMFDPDSDHVYNQTATPDYLGSIGGEYYIVAQDINSEATMTNYTFVQYALSINATITSDKPLGVQPGEEFNLTLEAHYWNNYSAPTENSSIDVNRAGSAEHWTAKTDSAGNAVVKIAAPPAVGTYVYNATITNQSETSGHVLTGYAEVSVFVFIVPMPDLIVRSQDIIYAPTNPYEGDNVTAQMTVRNIGNDDETFYILVTVRAGGNEYILKNMSVTLHALNETNNSTIVIVSWNAYLGIQELNVTLDPGDFHEEGSESNNFASISVTGAARPPVIDGQGMPLYVWVMVVVMILVVLGAVIALAMRRRRPRGKTGESVEEPEESP